MPLGTPILFFGEKLAFLNLKGSLGIGQHIEYKNIALLNKIANGYGDSFQNKTGAKLSMIFLNMVGKFLSSFYMLQYLYA